MRHLGILLVGMCVCCGGNPVAPPVSSSPPPPPFVGEWLGFIDIDYVFPLTGATTHDICDHRWTVQSQSGTAFNGMYRSGGGDAQFPRREPCLDSGGFSGFVSSDAQVSGLTFTPVLLGGASVNRDCSAVNRTTLVGTTNGLSISAEGMDVIECLVAGAPTRISRTVVLRLNKRNP